MGELRTRKRGKSWEWSFEGARVGGKRQPISKGGYRTKAEAVAAGTAAKAEYDSAGRVFRVKPYTAPPFPISHYTGKLQKCNFEMEYCPKMQFSQDSGNCIFFV